jgi:hypothetical protein
MKTEELCMYCDNKIMPNDTKCGVCDAEINHNQNKTNHHQEPIETQTRATINNAKVSENFALVCGNGGTGPVKSKIVARCAFDQEIREEPIEPSWTCSLCTFVNDPSHLCRDACFHEKTTEEALKAVDKLAATHPIPGDEVGYNDRVMFAILKKDYNKYM